MVEIGIVVVVISLLVSGILVGKALITAAELRAITTEHAIYSGAFKEFIDKYQAVPGDMNNAETVWGTDGTCGVALVNLTPRVATCNGNGAGTIGNWSNETVTQTTEWYRAWQQLANAGMIEGKYTGTRNSASGPQAQPGLNVPLSGTGKGGWSLLWMTSTNDNNYFFSSVPVASHVLIYGVFTSLSFTETGILTPADAKNIDEKMDDGLPHTGTVRSKRADATTCGVSSAITSDYLLTSTSQNCQLMFLLGM